MLLREFALPVADADAKGYAIVFAPTLAARLSELHAEYGSPNCVPVPSMLTDGRLMIGADILTEVEPGGLLAAMWAAADKTLLGQAVEVIPWAEAIAMLPDSVR
jgi:hypothetical protein